jgi:LmbE family N-acetylglucosaminyl deacetylase
MEACLPLPYPETWIAPPPGPVVVIAPHPDDEAIGCGGILALHGARGDTVHVVVATDGDLGDPRGLHPVDGYVALRREECARAAEVLRAQPPIFLGQRDQNVDAPALRASLLDVLRTLRPALVYHPPVAEMHVDHHVVGRVVRDALASLESRPRSFAYETWVPVVPTHVIDVSAVWAVKQRALECYPSQLAYNDYVRAAAGLAAYRAIFLPEASRVEAFAETTPRAGAQREDASLQ